MKTRTRSRASRRNHDSYHYTGGVRRSLKPALYALLVVKLYALFHTLALI